MTKAEILEAINATIAPNNVKGITAEALANILTEIVNATPEGGSGAGGEYIDMTMANPDDPTSMELTPEAMAHNAEVYNKLLTAVNGVQAVPMVSVSMGADMGMGMFADYVALEEPESETPNIIIGTHLSMGEFTNYMVQAVDMVTSETTSLLIGGDLLSVFFVLTPDGSVTPNIPGLM